MPATTLDRAPTFRFSDLSRAPKSVVQAVEKGPVFLDRRDGDELVLMRRKEAEAERLTLAEVSPLLGAFVGSSDTLPNRLRHLYPWLEFLADDDANTFIKEILQVSKSCASIGRFEPLATTIKAWQSTAEAIAAGWSTESYEWLDEPIIVEKP